MRTATVSAGRVPRLLDLFRRELALCNVRPDETIGIYMEGGERRDYAEAWATAAVALGARPFQLDMPAHPPATLADLGSPVGGAGLAGNSAALAALIEADLVVDLASLLHSPEQAQIVGSGTRMIMCVEPVDVLERLFPTSEQRDEALAAEELLGRAATIGMASEAGTEISYELGDYIALCQYGFADKPGRWDHFAGTLVGQVPNKGKADGIVVLQAGDLVFPFRRYLSEPVRMVVEDGYVAAIEGGVEAMFLRDYYESYGDPAGYQVSHLNWGLNPNARWDAIASGTGGIGMDARSLRGGVTFSTGPNHHHGGDNRSKCHVDIALRGCSVWVDDLLVVDAGRVALDARAVLAG
jgi:2,5-dihydroxypyridine 5,6-dioxygenase